MIQNSSGGFLTGLLPPTKGQSYKNIYYGNLPTGNTDLYTVPAGKKLYILGTGRAWNASAGSITAFMQVKIGGTYYQIGQARTMTTGTAGAIFAFPSAIILSAGDSISINCTTNSGLNMWLAGLEYDATDPYLNTYNTVALANGDNTVYTAPAGKNINIIGAWLFNASGGTRTYTVNVVPNAGTKTNANKFYTATAANLGLTGFAFPPNLGALTAGDTVILNSDSGAAGQIVFILAYEY